MTLRPHDYGMSRISDLREAQGFSFTKINPFILEISAK